MLNPLIEKIYPLIFDQEGDFLTPYQTIFQDSKFDKYKDQPLQLKLDMIHAISVCIIYGTTAETASARLMMQDKLLKGGVSFFNPSLEKGRAEKAFNLEGLKEYLVSHFKSPDVQAAFHASKEGCTGMTDNNPASSNKPIDMPNKFSSNFFIDALNYLSLPTRAVYVIFKMAISYFQSSDLDRYHSEKSFKDTPATPSNPTNSHASLPFFSSEKKAFNMHNSVLRTTENYWNAPENS